MYRLILLLALLLPPTAPTPRLIVLGDSITVGVGATSPDRTWPAIVARTLHRDLVNLAVSSTVAAQQPLPAILPSDLVIWLVGYNDVRAGTNIAAFTSTVAQARAALPGLLVASGLRMRAAGYAAAGPIWSHGSEAQTAAYAQAIRPEIDLSGVVPSPVADQIHPNDSQYAAIAQAMLDQLPPLAAQWVNDTLIVSAAPGCLWLVGGGRPAAWVGCDEPSYTLYPYGDQAYVPMGRTFLLVGQSETRLDVPSRVVVGLPWVVR